MTPLVIGRYALYAEIAAGGMATVHYGRLLGPVGFSRTVAIKRLHAHFAKDPEFAAMFLDEARLAARIRHPNVVQTLDVVAMDGELFLVMEYVQGESLSRLVRTCIAEERPAPLEVVSAIVCGALHGLHAAHEATAEDGEPLGIVHRDVSPQNVMIGSDGIPRVLDFGVAKAVGRAQTTREGQLKGKLAYMSPEQVRSEAVDRRTDVYAMGVVLWETLTRKRLFSGGNEAATIKNVLDGSRVPPSSVTPYIPESIDAVTLRAIAQDPRDRFQTAREMALALEAAMPVASATRMAEWIDGLVGDVLSQRARSVAEIESQSGIGQEGGVRRDGEPTQVDPAGSLRDVSASTSSQVSSVPVPPSRGRLVRGLAALFVVGAAVFGARMTLGLLAPKVPARPAATTLLDLPPPPTSVPEAAREFAAGMQTLHDNNWHGAAAHFERAALLDPMMAAAHLRFAMTSAARSREKSRSAYMRAATLRGQLSVRDRDLMEALEPVVLRSHGDPVEATRRLEILKERYPTDVEIYDLLGVVRPDGPDTLAASERAIALDPTDGQAWQTKGTALWTAGRLDEAREAFARCSELSVVSADCLWSWAATDKATGRCEDFETHARAYRDRNPGDGWSVLTAAMVAMNRPESAVRETFDQGVLRLPANERAHADLAFRGQLALLAGDFDAVRALGEEEAKAVDSDESARANFSPHYVLALRMIGAALESGDEKDASARAHDFIAKSATWARDPVPSRSGDLSVYLMRLDGPGGDWETKRQAWIDARVAEGHPRGTLWVPAYAAPAMTADEARAALEERSRFSPVAHGFDNESIEDAVVGHVYELAGMPRDALPYLRRAVASCNVLGAPVAHTRATLDLGAALEAIGDRAGACDAYARVVSRWGKARPRSFTADRARERATALACSR